MTAVALVTLLNRFAASVRSRMAAKGDSKGFLVRRCASSPSRLKPPRRLRATRLRRDLIPQVAEVGIGILGRVRALHPGEVAPSVELLGQPASLGLMLEGDNYLKRCGPSRDLPPPANNAWRTRFSSSARRMCQPPSGSRRTL